MSSLIELVLSDNYNPYLDTSRNVKPDKPKGYLVNTPVYKVPVEYFKDLATDTYDVVKGFNGKANDHELGKQNDVAMKLGSLAIAAYLMSFRTSKLTKLMEVVGLGSFFTSMALWPKLAIALPLKLRTGVDIQQKYVDSYNRKKNFFQDPQYLAWDLYSKEQINKIGDKMGVPYDVPNRDEVIKEKARKMAVQGNTLWMATAGFATPIATGLICGGLEPVVDNLRQKYALKHSQKVMDSLTWFDSNMTAPKAKVKDFEAYLAENMGSKLANTDELVKKMMWYPHRPLLMEDNLKKDLETILKDNTIDEKSAEKLRKAFNAINNYFAKEEKLHKWEEARSLNSADSMKAYSWKKVTNEIFSSMGFTSKEIEEMSKEGSKTLNIFDGKVQEIVANPDKYKKVVAKIAKQIAEFDAVTGEAAREQYRGYVDTICDISQKSLKELGLTSTSEYIGGRPFIKDAAGKILNETEALSGSVRNAKKVFFDEAILGERSSMYRILQILDLNKRMADGTLEGQYKQVVSSVGDSLKSSYNKVSQIAKKSLMEYGLNMHEAKLCNGADKVGFEGYRAIVKLLYGVLPERYIKDISKNVIANSTGTTPEGIKKGIQDASKFLKSYEKGMEAAYQEMLNMGYGSEKVQLNRLRTALDKDTIEALYDAGKKTGVDLVDNMKVYMQTFIDKVVNVPQSGALRNHNLEGHDLTGSMKGLADRMSNSLKSALVGTQPEALLRNAANEITNKSKWLRKFGIGGAVLLAGTVLSTLFFGHIPQKEMYMRNEKK